MLDDKLKTTIENIPDDGWWYISGKKVFIDTANKLLNKGFSVEEIIDILRSVYYAVGNEYGYKRHITSNK